MHLSRILVGLLLASCGRCDEPATAAPPAAPLPPAQLSDADTQPHPGRLTGEGWELKLDGAWLSVKEAPRKRFKPSVQDWLVDPAGPVFLTVECREPGALPVEASLRADLALSQERNAFTNVAFGAVGAGPWVEGALSQWVAGDMAHVQGRFRVLSSECDVHAWSPRKPELVARLHPMVLAFKGTHPGLLRELTAMSQTLRELELREAGDGGVQPVWYRVRTERAVAQAPVDLLVDRFNLRLRLLEALDTKSCAGLVRRRLDEAPEVLEKLDEASSIRWVQLTREALLKTEHVDAGSLPTTKETAAAVARLVASNSDFAEVTAALRAFDQAPDDVVCAAEKVRIKIVLAQPPEERALLLRSLVAR